MPHGHVAVRDGVVAREPRLAREKVVAPLVRLAGRGVIPDAEEAALAVIERGKVHAVAQCDGAPGGVAAAIFAQSGGEAGEACGEVAAVHGGDIARLERRARARVVPVVEVAVPLLQPLAGREDAVYELERALFCRHAEVGGGEAAHEREADIRRRGALRGAHGRLRLDVVGRQMTALPRAVFVEVAPDHGALADEEASLGLIRRRRARLLDAERGGEERREQPDYAERHADGRRRGEHQCGARSEAGHGLYPAFALCRLRRGLPLKEPPVRYEHAPERACRGGEVYPGLPGQEQQPQHGAAGAERRTVERAARVLLAACAAGQRAHQRRGQPGAEAQYCGDGRGVQPGAGHDEREHDSSERRGRDE